MPFPSAGTSLTFAEHRLWSRLSGGQLGDLQFQRKAVVGSITVDFFCRGAKLVVEVDDATPEAAASDLARQAYFERLGLSVLRFTQGQVQEDLEWVLGAIQLTGDRQRGQMASHMLQGAQQIGQPAEIQATEMPIEFGKLPSIGGSGGTRTGVAANNRGSRAAGLRELLHSLSTLGAGREAAKNRQVPVCLDTFPIPLA